MMSIRNTLIYKTSRGAGLANRLRALIGYKALADCLDMDFALCWTQECACPTDPEQVFERTFCRLISTSELAALMSNCNHVICEESAWFDSAWLWHGENKVTYEHYLRTVSHELQNIEFADAVLSEVNYFAKVHKFNALPLTGIHIRHTDNIFEYKKWSTSARGNFSLNKTSNLDGFLPLMDELAKTGRFFLASDNQDIVVLALQRYGDRVLAYNKLFDETATEFWRNENPDKRQLAAKQQFNLRTRTTSITDALIELLLLSRCREVIGTYYSSFGKMAALLGGIAYSELQGRECVADPMVSGKMQLRCSQFLRY